MTETERGLRAKAARWLRNLAATLSGQFESATAVGGDAVDLRGSQGAILNPTGPVTQHFGDLILQQAAEPGASAAVLRQAYLYRLMQETRRLSLGGVDPKAASGTQSSELRLSAVYTALLTQRPEAFEPGMRHAETAPERESWRLSAVAVLNAEPRLVLLGDPGGGKTTFVNFVALCLAGESLGDAEANLAALTAPLPPEDERRQRDEKPQPQPWQHGALLPVRVVLRDFAARGLPPADDPACTAVNGDTLWAFIAAEVGEMLKDYVPHLKKDLLARGGLILLDGLDEVPDAAQRRMQVKAAVQGFAACFPRCRFLVTSRTYAYQRQDWKLDGFTEVVLSPFTAGQITRFVDGWYAHIAAVRGLDAADAQGRAVLLKTAIARSERLAELAARPLLLTLMASLHAWRGGSLPEKREELYADTVDLLLDQWESPKVVRDITGRAQVQQPSLAEWLKVDRAVVRAELERLAFEVHRDQPRLEGTADIAQGRLVDGLLRAAPDPALNPARLVEHLRDRAGLLAARGEGVYTFPHRTFQEYLAACYLTDHDFPDLVAGLARTDPQRWREAALLAGAKSARGTASAVWNLAEALCYRPVPPDYGAEDAWGALLAAQVLLENAGGQLGQVSERNAPKLALIRQWQRAIVERGWLPPVDRLLAGNALAVLGDARDWEELIGIPEGAFLLGSPETDEMGQSEEKPQHEVWLADYQIGKYPVTVGQWKRFIQAHPDYAYDRDSLQGFDNHPAHDVSWYDARAYCDWLTQEWRKAGKIGADEVVRLPSEAEWEKAAAWDGATHRRYPWGEDWDATKANGSETGLGGTSPVGMFPAGASPCGCLDMAGNVWEWTTSLWGKDYNLDFKYPYRADDGRENLAADDRTARVLRGGAFDDAPDELRCAFRYLRLPDFRGISVGFRVVVSPSVQPLLG